MDNNIKNEKIYETIKKEDISKESLNDNILCENDFIIHSFDLINPLLIAGFDLIKLKPRRFFNIQTLEYEENENMFISIIKPCKF